MKKVLMLLLMVATVTIISKAQNAEPQQPAPVVNPNAPDIVFDSDVHDFGTIDYDGNGTCVFKFTNKGKEPLIISNAKASCGCTVPDWPKEPIAPGKTGQITVKYNTKRPGKFNKSVTVTSNAKISDVVIRITGTVKDNPNPPAPPAAPETAPVKKDEAPLVPKVN